MIGPRRRAAIAFFLVNLGAVASVACGLRQALGLKQAMNSLTERSARSAEQLLVMPRRRFAAALSAMAKAEGAAPGSEASTTVLTRLLARHTTDILTKNGAFCACAVAVAETPPLSTPRPVEKEAPAAADLSNGRPRPKAP